MKKGMINQRTVRDRMPIRALKLKKKVCFHHNNIIFLQLERIHQQEYMIQVINITFLIETALIELRSQSLKSNSVFTFGQSAFMFTKKLKQTVACFQRQRMIHLLHWREEFSEVYVSHA